MKQLKNILLTGFLALLAFAACTEDKLIDEQPMETGTVSISFSTEGVETKAIDAGGNYEYATAEELNINEIFVSIFKKEGNEWKYLTSKSGTLGDGSFVGEQSPGSFKLTGLTLPLNTDLKVVAIANPLAGKAASYAEMDYNTLSAEKVAYSATLGGEGYYTFDPKTLIKVGEQDMRFTANNGAISGGEDVHLKQLATKVQLSLAVEVPSSKLPPKPDEEGLVFGDYDAGEIVPLFNKNNMQSANDLNDPMIVKNIKGSFVIKRKSEWGDDTNPVIATAYNASGDTDPIIPKEYQGSNIKKAKITGAKYKNTSYTPTSYFELKGVEIKNIEKSSTLLIPRGQLPSSTLDNITKSITEGVENVDITFYTYEKPVYVSDTSEALTVNITGRLAEGYAKTISIYELNKLYLHWQNSSGWAEGSSSFSIIKETTGEGEMIGQGYEFNSAISSAYLYPIIINPKYVEGKCTDGLIHGNYYKVTGTLKRSTGEFKLWVTPWIGKDVSANFN